MEQMTGIELQDGERAGNHRSDDHFESRFVGSTDRYDEGLRSLADTLFTEDVEGEMIKESVETDHEEQEERQRPSETPLHEVNLRIRRYTATPGFGGVPIGEPREYIRGETSVNVDLTKYRQLQPGLSSLHDMHFTDDEGNIVRFPRHVWFPETWGFDDRFTMYRMDLRSDNSGGYNMQSPEDWRGHQDWMPKSFGAKLTQKYVDNVPIGESARVCLGRYVQLPPDGDRGTLSFKDDGGETIHFNTDEWSVGLTTIGMWYAEVELTRRSEPPTLRDRLYQGWEKLLKKIL